jgi:hypothetical protein
MVGLIRAEVAPFLARLVRLDPAAVVRLRPAGMGSAVDLWSRLPWRVLVHRRVHGNLDTDITVTASGWLDRIAQESGELPSPANHEWRWPLPPSSYTSIESLPALQVRRLGVAAAETLRAARGRVGDRALRDALLDHVPIVVNDGQTRVEVPQRLVQALLRMDFMGTQNDGQVTVCIAPRWVSLTAIYGSVWLQTSTSLTVSILR